MIDDLAIGRGREWWGLHRIAAPASVDSIARLTFTAAPAAGRYLARGPLAAGVSLTRAGAPATLTLTAVQPLSCLLPSDYARPCPR